MTAPASSSASVSVPPTDSPTPETTVATPPDAPAPAPETVTPAATPPDSPPASTPALSPEPPASLTPEQVAAKVEVNQLGDQDAVNLAAAATAVPESSTIATAENVRQFPWLFSQEVIDSFLVDDTLTDEARAEHNRTVEEHWASFTIPNEAGE